MPIGHARIPTFEQDLDLQTDALKRAGSDPQYLSAARTLDRHPRDDRAGRSGPGPRRRHSRGSCQRLPRPGARFV
jgi:hypothetical protein